MSRKKKSGRLGSSFRLSQERGFLDPRNAKIQLDTVFKAAHVLGRDVKLELV
jgi:hypothetical protein